MNHTKHVSLSTFRYSRLAWLICCPLSLFLVANPLAQAQEYFNPELLELDSPVAAGADLTLFENGETQAPGKYRVDIQLNNEIIDTRELEFRRKKDAQGKESLQPCLNLEFLTMLGVKVEQYPALKESPDCIDIMNVIPQANAYFLFSQQRLELSIPQVALNVQARDYVSPEKWDQGIPALLVNYSFSGANSRAHNNNAQDSDSYYMNLRSGLNFGAWRLRNYSTLNRSSDGQFQWQHINSYLQRDVIALKSQLVLGDSSSPSDVFDSVSFRGAQLASDDEMLPDSLKGFAPIVRGVAKSNAQVTIRQNGYVIYQNYVPAGAFEIKDLYPTAGSGDLNVTIKEADGSEQSLVVPFAAVPVLQREGRLKYALTAGQYRSFATENTEQSPFAQATAIYGLPYGMTAYGGIQTAQLYQAVSLGWGQNLGTLGALSTDVTQAWIARENNDDSRGQSWRVRYGKNFIDSGTNFSLASYRYSSAGFYTLTNALDSYKSTSNNNVAFGQPKSRAELTMSQNLWSGFGSLSASVIDESFWNSGRKTQSASISYNNSWENISYGMNYIYSQSGGEVGGLRANNSEQTIAFNVSIALSKWLPNAYATYSMNNNLRNRSTHNIGLNGTLLEEHNLNYGVSQGFSGQDGASSNLNVNYDGRYGEINVGYGYDKQQQRLNYGLQGGVVVHEDGVTLSQPLGETVALVKVPGANDVNIVNESGVRTDWRGYAVVPYTTPYHKNSVVLDPGTLPEDIDVLINSKSVIPTRGAIVRADFKTQAGRRVLMTLTKRDGNPVPFGALVNNTPEHREDNSIVGDDGQVYLVAAEESGKLHVKWGAADSQQCWVNYSLPKVNANTGLLLIKERCL